MATETDFLIPRIDSDLVCMQINGMIQSTHMVVRMINRAALWRWVAFACMD